MSVRTLDITEAVGPLSEYAQQAGLGPVVVTINGKPVAVVIALENADLETVSLSTNPRFLALIERSRAHQREAGGIPGEEMRRRLGLT